MTMFFIWSEIAVWVHIIFLRIFMYYTLVSEALCHVSIHKYITDTVVTILIYSEHLVYIKYLIT